MDEHSMRDEGFGSACHPACFACRPSDEGGLGLRFRRSPGGGVEAVFSGEERYQGYPDRLHGGIIAMLLDAAMTHCLFARHVRAYTAKLALRYALPSRVGVPCVIRAELVRSRPPAYVLRAEVRQEGEVCARAEATFLASAPSEPPGPGSERFLRREASPVAGLEAARAGRPGEGRR